jgi:hypothetical protein
VIYLCCVLVQETAANELSEVLQSRLTDYSQQRSLHHLSAFLSCLAQSRQVNTTAEASDSSAIVFSAQLAHAVLALKPSQLESTVTSSVQYWHNGKVDHLPVIPTEHLQHPVVLARCALQLSETLFSDAVQLQSMLGYTMQVDRVIESAAHICALLNAGFAYVASESGKLLGLLPSRRSMLILNRCSEENIVCSAGNISANRTSQPEEWHMNIPVQLRKRAKDMHRVFRNNVKQTLSLRLNTDLDLAVQRLSDHHAQDCWVGPALQEVWRHMCATAPMQMLIFELWYGDTMIAADYAHPVNRNGVYVATRFFDRSEEYKRLAPGFLLALVETKYLRDLGCKIWDLGTANMCPLMRYKLDLTGEPLSRPQALHELALAAHDNASVATGTGDGSDGDFAGKGACGLSVLTAGVLIHNISIQDILT